MVLSSVQVTQAEPKMPQESEWDSTQRPVDVGTWDLGWRQ